MANDKFTTFEDFTKLSGDTDISDKFNAIQWRALQRVARRQKLTPSDRRVLRSAGLMKKNGTLTIVGNACVSNINKKRNRTNKRSQPRKVFPWENND